MDKNTVASMIDHAVLKLDATDADMIRECGIAIKYKIATFIVKPSHVTLAREYLKDSGVKLGSVVGFPHGSSTTRTKVAEAVEAIENGAEELDMVINVGKLLSGDDEYVRNDMAQVAAACHQQGVPLKVILETALLNDDMKVKACKLAEEAGVDYVKTSTGFNGGGATLRDVEIMKNSVSSKVKVKAAGGIRNFEQTVEYINAGCSRLGTSATEQILSGGTAEGVY